MLVKQPYVNLTLFSPLFTIQYIFFIFLHRFHLHSNTYADMLSISVSLNNSSFTRGALLSLYISYLQHYTTRAMNEVHFNPLACTHKPTSTLQHKLYGLYEVNVLTLFNKLQTTHKITLFYFCHHGWSLNFNNCE